MDIYNEITQALCDMYDIKNMLDDEIWDDSEYGEFVRGEA